MILFGIDGAIMVLKHHPPTPFLAAGLEKAYWIFPLAGKTTGTGGGH
jgi:hypothetical protein